MSYKCPECGSIVLYDYETENEVVFYCINCKKNVKLLKNPVTPEKLKGLNNWTDKAKLTSESLPEIYLTKYPQGDEEFINSLKIRRIINGKHR